MKMKCLLPILLLVCIGMFCRAGRAPLDQYNVTWNSPSANSSESMLLGGHSIGLNVWVEDGDLLFYAQRSGSFSENNEYLKLGRFRLRLDPNPLKEGGTFRQELKLRQGYVEIYGEKEGSQVRVDLWVEARRPVIHLEVEGNEKLEATVSYESWRHEDFELLLNQPGETGYSRRFGCFSLECFPGTVIRYRDEISHEGNSVLFYHRNRSNKLLIDYMVKQQGLEDYRNEIADTQKGRTFGGRLIADGFVDAGTSTGKYAQVKFKAWSLRSRVPAAKHNVTIYTHIDQTETVEEWKSDLDRLVSEKKKNIREETRAWWNDFWNRSWISINPEQVDPDSEVWQAARNYQLFRYQLGCNFYGEYPTKFNGGNFTFDPGFVLAKGDPKKKPFNLGPTPDWRAWGGGSFTAQNQRLLYWPLLKTGDFGAMTSQFDFYRRALPTAIARVKAYWGHGGCLFTEQMENFGLPIACAWGWTEPGAKNRIRPEGIEHGVQVNGAVGYHYQAQLEFAYMILEYHRYTGADISEYMEFIKQSLRFFDEHYQMRLRAATGQPLDEEGKLVIAPSTACESYKEAVNPIDVCAGLRACLDAVLNLPERYVSESERKYFAGLLLRVPEFNYDEVEGDRIIKPARTWTRYQNSECPQFYPLFPYNRFELGEDEEDIQVFRNTWLHGTFPKTLIWSWHQDGIFYARMGLTDKAKWYNVQKLKDCTQRFPTFWGPGHDWVPDHNWGGSGMIGLQEMLMQTVGDKIRLFPAWPKEWDVDFKLHAPHETVIEGSLKDGMFKLHRISPPERENDVILMLK